MTTTTITIKQASQSVNKLATDFMEHETLDAKLLEIVTASLTSEEHLHIRDYLLGMPIDFGTGFMIQFQKLSMQEHLKKSLMRLRQSSQLFTTRTLRQRRRMNY